MRVSRIFYPGELQEAATVLLDEKTSHYLLNVLRLRVHEPVILFNGNGGEFDAELIAIKHRCAELQLKSFRCVATESPLTIHLMQALLRADKMDYVLQKTVELGVQKITPIFTEYSERRLQEDRLDKRMQHWRNIIISACEQSGRVIIPEIALPQSFDEAIKQVSSDLKLLLHPYASLKLSQLPQSALSLALMIGPEGGFSEVEVA